MKKKKTEDKTKKTAVFMLTFQAPANVNTIAGKLVISGKPRYFSVTQEHYGIWDDITQDIIGITGIMYVSAYPNADETNCENLIRELRTREVALDKMPKYAKEIAEATYAQCENNKRKPKKAHTSAYVNKISLFEGTPLIMRNLDVDSPSIIVNGIYSMARECIEKEQGAVYEGLYQNEEYTKFNIGTDEKGMAIIYQLDMDKLMPCGIEGLLKGRE